MGEEAGGRAAGGEIWSSKCTGSSCACTDCGTFLSFLVSSNEMELVSLYTRFRSIFSDNVFVFSARSGLGERDGWEQVVFIRSTEM